MLIPTMSLNRRNAACTCAAGSHTHRNKAAYLSRQVRMLSFGPGSDHGDDGRRHRPAPERLLLCRGETTRCGRGREKDTSRRGWLPVGRTRRTEEGRFHGVSRGTPNVVRSKQRCDKTRSLCPRSCSHIRLDPNFKAQCVFFREEKRLRVSVITYK